MHNNNKRDAGLVRVVGPWALAANIISMVVGAGIFAVPAALAASAGTFAPWVFLACGLAIGAVAICFAEGGSRIPTSGGVYGTIEAAFGPLAGFVAGTFLWVSCVLSNGGVAAALGDLIAGLTPPSVAPVARTVTIIAALGVVAWVNIHGVGRGVRLVAATTTLKLVPLVLFVAIGASGVHGSNFAATGHADVHGLGRAMILAAFAFIGMETSLCASGEVAQPNRTIPRALAIAMISTTLLYVAIQVVAQGILGPALPASTAPLADAMASIHPALRALMLTGMALSLFGWISSDLLGSPRQLFAFGRDGLLPGVLGRLHPRSHAPYMAILTYAAIGAVLAITGTFAELAVLATLTMALLYGAGCAAAWLLARRRVAEAGTPLNFRFLGAAASIGIVSMGLMIGLGTRTEIVGLLVILALSVLIYLLQTRLPFASPGAR